MRRWLLACCALILLAAGCSASSSTATSSPAFTPATLPLDDSGSDAATTTDAAEGPITTPSAALPTPAPPEPLTMVVGQLPVVDPLGVDPLDLAGLQLLDLLYEGLTRWDLDAGTWKPALAAQSSVSDDGRTWRFELSPDATFSDGTTITADDVVRSVETILGVPGTLAAVRLEGVDAVTAVDASTVEIELSRPDPAIPAILSHPLFGIVPPGTADGAVTSGSFILDGRRLTPVRDVLPDIEIVVHDETSKPRDASGDLVFVAAGPTPVHEVTTLAEIHFGFNTSSWKLAGVKRRELIASAVDQTELAELVGSAIAIDTLLPVIPCAESCLAELEPTTSTLPELWVDYVSDPDAGDDREVELAEELAAQLRRAGIPAQARAHSLHEFVELVRSGEHEIYRTGWVGLVDELEGRLAPYVSDGLDNVSGYASEDFDAAMAIARASGESADYLAAAELLDDGVVVIPVARVTRTLGLGERLDPSLVRPDGTVDIALAYAFE